MIMVFITVNRNGDVGLWFDEPTRNEKTGKWEGKLRYLNSISISKAKAFIEQTKMDWESDPVPIKL